MKDSGSLFKPLTSAVACEHPAARLTINETVLIYLKSSLHAQDLGIAALYTEQISINPSSQLENWQFPIDNKFAREVVLDIGQDASAPRSLAPARLCDSCHKLDFWSPDFYIEEISDKLRQNSETCDLCRLLWKAWSETARLEEPNAVVRFERTESIIKMVGVRSLPVLSLLRNLDAPNLASGIQIGLPQLPKPGSDQSLQIFRQWLKDCDDNHTGCRFVGEAKLPTRLIDLGSLQSPILRLVKTADGVVRDSRYVALSHRWGDIKTHRPFCTRLKDMSGRGHDYESFKTAIPSADVPQTFRDVVEITRRLGIRYLWIDSLCIIQGDGGDFSTEAKRMENIFSCAYCVIAASRASNQAEGFLGERTPRQFLTIQQDGSPPFYVCEAIDDFGHHVLDAALNRRGWVLQERALARRTIYFADAQTYFECGEGVRCETLVKMQNNMADFLGDARFPERAMRTNSRALKIRYFQDLYRRYSQLEFSHIQDRPVAIAGLESQLRKAYWTKGDYGIFDDGPGHGLFHRSLLWQRSEEEQTLKAIDFSEHREYVMPSWSWMAYEGGIDYLDPPFQKVDWEKSEVEPPWSHTGGGSDDSHDSRVLKVVVRSFNVAGHQPDEIKLIYDNPERKATSDGQRPMCIVVAKAKEGASVRRKRHYVLIVINTGSMTARGQKVFTRLGVGYMPGKYIVLGEDAWHAVVA
ncbi:Fc.00g108290.m01.CDS01 [Cosmosporella sp. VM-42]